MTQAKKDNNNINTLLATSNADGITPSLLKSTPSTHILDVSDASTGTEAASRPTAPRDDNMVPVMIAASSADGITPIAMYLDPSTGQLLIDSN